MAKTKVSVLACFLAIGWDFCGPAWGDLIIEFGSTVAVTNNAVLDSSGSVFVGGVLDASGEPAGQIRLTQNWNKPDGGIFVAGGSTVTFYNLMTSSITGNTTFHVLASNQNGKTLRFQQDSTQTVIGPLDLGHTSLGNEVKLRSTEDGQKWSFSLPNGARRVAFVNVQDANAFGNLIKACDSIDNGNNNAGWLFPGALSVTISGANYDFGSVAIGSGAVTSSSILVVNNGCSGETFQLRAATATPDTPWSVGPDAATGPGDDRFLLRAAFHNVQPSTPVFAAEDVVNAGNQSSDGTRYSIDGTQTGAAVAEDAQRNLWWYLQMPLSTSTTWQQRINATVTAAP